MYYPPNPVPDQGSPDMSIPMPPMAKPGLPGRPSAPGSGAPESEVAIRKDFPETWLFNTFNFNTKYETLLFNIAHMVL